MVRYFILIAFSLFSLNSVSEGFSADSLRERIKNKESQRKEVDGRLKAMKKNSSVVERLRNRRIFYRLPDGRNVKGIILPNNKKSPAIKNVNGVLVPACLTTSNSLVPGRFDEAGSVVVCELEAAKLAFIDDSIYGTKDQAISRSPKVRASKYSEKNSPKTDDVRKSKKTKTSSKAAKYATNGGEIKKTEPKNPYIYSPPSGSATGAVVSSLVTSENKSFGIRIGTWAEVRLLRPVSSADSGKVEFVLQADVRGEYRTLPAGTTLFGSKRVNESNKRLESAIDFAITPDGEEIKEIDAWIYSPNQTAGLPGKLIRDREGESKAAGGNAALKGLAIGAGRISGAGSIGGAMVESYTDDMVRNEQKYAPRSPKAVIRVAPQSALIRFSKTI